MTQQLLDNYYGVITEFRSELRKRIIDSIKKDDELELHDTEEYDDEFYDLPTFYIIDKYGYHNQYHIVKVKSNGDVIGVGGEDMEEWTSNLLDLETDSLYDLYKALANL